MLNAVPDRPMSRLGTYMMGRGALLIILGILCFAFPGATILTVAIFLGLLLAASGIVMAVRSVLDRRDIPAWGLYMVVGIAEALIGVAMLASPGITAVSIPLALGIWALVAGSLEIVGSIGLADHRVKNWWIGLVLGAATIILGFVAMSSVSAGIALTIALLGSAAIIAGVESIVVGYRMREIRRGRLGQPEVTEERRAA